jgi:hypothetical protein
MIFVLSHLAAGARALMLSHGVVRLHADHFLSGGRHGRRVGRVRHHVRHVRRQT